MRNLGILVVLIFMASCQQDKIGFVDNVKLIDGYQEKLDVEGKFNKKAETLTKKRDSISQAIQLELQAFQTKAQSMSQKKAQEEYNVLQQRSQFIGQQLQQEQQQLQQTGQAELDSVITKVRDEVKAYGEANGYSFILGEGQGGGVLFGKAEKDLTDEILKILNDKYKK
ncbi:MAG: OmpH family outer membrane protein [Croceitalea sp.]|nr:OmpH family outer membrane protein [Croceitalea sp.]NNL09050.1 OmpH family outer membrane protein [Croceitalea sp.]